jgi:hypothetical protein
MVGLEEPTSGLNIYVYPNPASNQVEVSGVKLDVDDKVEMINANGKIIYKASIEKATSNYRLKTSDYSNGLYFLKLQSKQNKINYTSKVLIHH